MEIKHICSVCGKELVENGHVDRDRWWIELPNFPHKSDEDRVSCREKWAKERTPGTRYTYDVIRKEVPKRKKRGKPIRSRHFVRYSG